MQHAIVGNPNLQSRLVDELIYALKATPKEELSNWGKQIGIRFLSVGVKRVTNLGSLLSKVATGTADELVDVIEAVTQGRAGVHLDQKISSVTGAARNIVLGVESAFNGVAKLFQEKPDEAAVGLLSSVVGFYLGIGHGTTGFGDGGIPDLDLTLGGIGWHRSIFTHSIIAGAFVETAVLSLIDLNKTVHQNLPKEHSSFWDDLLRYADAAGNSFVTGASLGIASHLGIDTAIDGFTPYKDLPISLPIGAHEFLMGINAVAEGSYGTERVLQGVSSVTVSWQNTPSDLHGSGHDKGILMTKISNPNSLSLEALNTHLDNLSPEERINQIGEMARKTAEIIGSDSSRIDKCVSLAKSKIEAAKEPFRLGIIGEFRVGKSTLINALLGQEVAFTDIIEATASECRFRFGKELKATFIYKNSEPETFSISEANQMLSDRREDIQWLGLLDHVEYTVDAECLRQFDLWDAPGIGGNEENEKMANRFIERLGGALWVMDANLVGKASIAGPLQQLKSAGKPVICVINRIDEYQGAPSEIVNFIERSYPGLFAAVIPISAYNAFVDKASGRSNSELENLWDLVLSVMGSDEIQGGVTRLAGSTGVATMEVGGAIVSLKRELRDRIGLVEHIRYNLRDAGANLVGLLPEILNEETEKAFFNLESELWKIVEEARGERRDGPIPVDQVIVFLKNERKLSSLTEVVTKGTMERLNRKWSALTNDAFSLSLAAVSLPSNALSMFSVARAASTENQLSRKAIEEGVYVGGVSAAIAGTLAAASTLVTWPAILVALPIGALAAWREQKKVAASSDDFSTQVKKLLTTMKQQFITTLGRQIQNSIESAIDLEIERSVEVMTAEITGVHDLQMARDLENRVSLMISALGVTADYESKVEWTEKAVLTMLENPGGRLDLFLPELSFSLSPLLVTLPPETEIRLLIATNRDGLLDLPELVDRAFGGWSGKKRVRSITYASGEPVNNLPTMIITSEEALVTEDSLRSLTTGSIRFVEHPQGRMAAQRQFASMWEGRGSKGEAFEVAPVL